jgi:hypothetical protein
MKRPFHNETSQAERRWRAHELRFDAEVVTPKPPQFP